jgi:hypothetical protein
MPWLSPVIGWRATTPREMQKRPRSHPGEPIDDFASAPPSDRVGKGVPEGYWIADDTPDFLGRSLCDLMHGPYRTQWSCWADSAANHLRLDRKVASRSRLRLTYRRLDAFWLPMLPIVQCLNIQSLPICSIVSSPDRRLGRSTRPPSFGGFFSGCGRSALVCLVADAAVSGWLNRSPWNSRF